MKGVAIVLCHAKDKEASPVLRRGGEELLVHEGAFQGAGADGADAEVLVRRWREIHISRSETS